MIIWCHQSGSSMFTVVDAVLVLHVPPARHNTKCRHSTQQTVFIPLSMNPSALDIPVSTINPYHCSFSSTQHSFGILYGLLKKWEKNSFIIFNCFSGFSSTCSYYSISFWLCIVCVHIFGGNRRGSVQHNCVAIFQLYALKIEVH